MTKTQITAEAAADAQAYATWIKAQGEQARRTANAAAEAQRAAWAAAWAATEDGGF